MHTSLTTRTNILLLLLYSSVLLVCFAASAPAYPAILLPFGIGGLAAGFLQANAILAARQVFQSAQTWSAVRKALMSSMQGKLSIILLWLNGVAVLALILFGGQLVTMATVVGAYASFGFARELSAYRSVRTLALKQ